jgi:NAD(P)-dependent dehydrogenase (short-subunit alcohol dehydrogenase family)
MNAAAESLNRSRRFWTSATAELMKAILQAPVDLLWNGGIGTYVKASTETNAEVGDRANDALRVNGADLRCRVVGEGGNLGFTQKARLEYWQRGDKLAVLTLDLTDVGSIRAAVSSAFEHFGHIDFVVSNNNGPVRLLRNQCARRGHWLTVRLEAPKLNRFGIGARVAVLRPHQDALWRRVHTDGSYLSSSDVRAHFGLGAQAEIDAVVVRWPDHSEERFEGIRADRIVTLRKGTGRR